MLGGVIFDQQISYDILITTTANSTTQKNNKTKTNSQEVQQMDLGG